ncbi:NAD-dependent epimerase/dehydratase family protein [Sphingomonas sp.]|uniref:NAD-dependent epimerase/dehydratase family protein n=1 Tax=Sphingomonas sp. TaxID=28214 RepID=UPI003CC5047C
MKVAITGSTGFVGRTLTERLRARAHVVIPLVRRATADKCAIVIGDLGTEPQPVQIPQINAMIHLAALTHSKSTRQNGLLHRVNVGGTARALEIACRAGASRFIYLSSIKVNGERTFDRPFRPDDLPAPEDDYARSKLAAEHMVLASLAESPMTAIILRPPLLFGSGQKGNVAALARLVSRGIPLPFASIANRRSLMHVGNLADLIVTLLERPLGDTNVLLAADDTIISTPDLVRAMAAAQGRSTRLFPVPLRFMRLAARLIGARKGASSIIDSLEIDDSITRNMLGWSPPMKVDEAIADAFSVR